MFFPYVFSKLPSADSPHQNDLLSFLGRERSLLPSSPSTSTGGPLGCSAKSGRVRATNTPDPTTPQGLGLRRAHRTQHCTQSLDEHSQARLTRAVAGSRLAAPTVGGTAPLPVTSHLSKAELAVTALIKSKHCRESTRSSNEGAGIHSAPEAWTRCSPLVNNSGFLQFIGITFSKA